MITAVDVDVRGRLDDTLVEYLVNHDPHGGELAYLRCAAREIAQRRGLLVMERLITRVESPSGPFVERIASVLGALGHAVRVRRDSSDLATSAPLDVAQRAATLVVESDPEIAAALGISPLLDGA